MTRQTIEAIRWVDSCSYRSGWIHYDDVDDSVSEIVSVGHLVSETKSTVTISAHARVDGQQIHCPMTIPKCAIVRRKKVRL